MLKYLKLVMVLLLPLAISSNAQNITDAVRLAEPGIINSASSLGMGNATISNNIGYSNYLNNPAALGLLKSSEFVFSFNFDSIASDNTYFNNKLSNYQNANGINDFGFAYKVPTSQGSLVFGMGYSKIKNFNNITDYSGYNNGNNSLIQDLTSVNSQLTYDLRLSHGVFDASDNYLYDETYINGKLQQDGLITESGNVDEWQFSGAVEISKGLYVGATLNLIGGTYSNDREYTEADTRNVYGGNLQMDPDDPLTIDFKKFYVNDNIQWEISGVNLKAGFLYVLSPMLKIAGAIQTPTGYKINETYFVQGSSYFQNDYGYDVTPQTSKQDYSISSPFIYSFGASAKLMFLSLSAETELIDYSQTEFTDGFSSAERVEKNKEIMNNLGFAPRYKFGVVANIPRTGVSVKGGFIYLNSPYKDAKAENAKKYFTVGVGVLTEGNFGVDIAGAYGYWKDYLDVYGNNIARVNRDVTDLKVVVSLKYLF